MRGFSLIELLSILFILGFLSLFAFPSISQQVARYQLKQTVAYIDNLVRMIRMDAIARGTDIFFSLEPTAAGVRLCWQPMHQVSECSEAFQDVKVHWNFAANPMLFRGHSGMAGFSAGHILIQAGKRNNTQEIEDRYRVIVSTLGRIRVCAEHGSDLYYAAC